MNAVHGAQRSAVADVQKHVTIYVNLDALTLVEQDVNITVK